MSEQSTFKFPGKFILTCPNCQKRIKAELVNIDYDIEHQTLTVIFKLDKGE